MRPWTSSSRNNYNALQPYTPGSYLNPVNVKYDPRSVNFLNAALAGTGLPVNGGGPIWAIFDADAVKREKWNPAPPNVDIEQGTTSSRPTTIAELAKQGRHEVSAQGSSRRCFAKHGSQVQLFCGCGQGRRFRQARALSTKYKLPPSTRLGPCLLSTITRAGLRINGKCQVIDLNGQVIPGLYCGGESAGGFSEHGLARCTVQGRIAGKQAAAEKT